MIPPHMQPNLLFENINGTTLIEMQDNNSIRGSAVKNLRKNLFWKNVLGWLGPF